MNAFEIIFCHENIVCSLHLLHLQLVSKCTSDSLIMNTTDPNKTAVLFGLIVFVILATKEYEQMKKQKRFVVIGRKRVRVY